MATSNNPIGCDHPHDQSTVRLRLSIFLTLEDLTVQLGSQKHCTLACQRILAGDAETTYSDEKTYLQRAFTWDREKAAETAASRAELASRLRLTREEEGGDDDNNNGDGQEYCRDRCVDDAMRRLDDALETAALRALRNDELFELVVEQEARIVGVMERKNKERRESGISEHWKENRGLATGKDSLCMDVEEAMKRVRSKSVDRELIEDAHREKLTPKSTRRH